MKSPFYFLIEPYGDEYQNTIEIAGKEVIVNSSVENHKHVNRFAKVLQTPIHYTGDIKNGDIIIVHHNVFRIYYDMKGRAKKSPNFLKDNIYIIEPFQFYMYHNGKEWCSVDNWCFVKPADKEHMYLYEEGLEENTGFLKYGNQALQKRGVSKGEKVKFSKNSEYEFFVDGEMLYRMHTRDIIATL
jgi:hypothetical protein